VQSREVRGWAANIRGKRKEKWLTGKCNEMGKRRKGG